MAQKKIEIVEVGPRDGLQNEPTPLNAATRYEFVRRLSNCHLKRIEVGAFVSPKWVPQMADTHKVVGKVNRAQSSGELPAKTRYSTLVPNVRGMEDAIKSGVREIAVFGACSESFSQRNINCTTQQSFKNFAEVIRMARQHKVKVRGYLSTAFGCPFEGKVSQARVARLTEKMLELGVFEVSLGDTIGVATPKQVRTLLKRLTKIAPAKNLAMHFHDTRGMALANVLASLDFDISVFDASLGGLGGCPYAPGALGNLATEDLVYMLHGMGYRTGVDIEGLIALKPYMEKKVKKKLPSRVGESGIFKAL